MQKNKCLLRKDKVMREEKKNKERVAKSLKNKLNKTKTGHAMKQNLFWRKIKKKSLIIFQQEI